jgi:hypothetical protein
MEWTGRWARLCVPPFRSCAQERACGRAERPARLPLLHTQPLHTVTRTLTNTHTIIFLPLRFLSVCAGCACVGPCASACAHSKLDQLILQASKDGNKVAAIKAAKQESDKVLSL